MDSDSLDTTYLIFGFSVLSAAYYIHWLRKNWKNPEERQNRVAFLFCLSISAIMGLVTTFTIMSHFSRKAPKVPTVQVESIEPQG